MSATNADQAKLYLRRYKVAMTKSNKAREEADEAYANYRACLDKRIIDEPDKKKKKRSTTAGRAKAPKADKKKAKATAEDDPKEEDEPEEVEEEAK